MKCAALNKLLPGLFAVGWMLAVTSASGRAADQTETPAGPQRLVMIGGGEMPRPAINQLVDWGFEAAHAAAKPGEPAKIKIGVIVWSTISAEKTFKEYRDDVFIPALKAKGYEDTAFEIYSSPNRADMTSSDPKVRKAAIESIEKNLPGTSVIMFSGGDQHEAVKVMKAYPEIVAKLRRMYNSGVPFGGTSAGTALMSNPMIVGDDVDPTKYWSEEGFGLLPPELMVDQHFLKRKRKERLGAMMLKARTHIGIGVEEDGAVTVEGNRLLTVLGDKKITLLFNEQNTSIEMMDEVVLTTGQRIDLQLPHLNPNTQTANSGTPSAARDTVPKPTSLLKKRH